MLIDLHVLITQGNAKEIARQAIQAGLDGIVLVGFKALPPRDFLHNVRTMVESKEIKVFAGVEVPLSEGHVLVYPRTLDYQIDFSGATTQEDSDKILEHFDLRGDALIACHPYYTEAESAMGDLLFQLNHLHGALIVTAFSPDSANDLAVEALESLNLPGCGGSSAESPLGKAATLFLGNIEHQDQLAERLRQGDLWAVAIGPEHRWTDRQKEPLRKGRRAKQRQDKRKSKDSRYAFKHSAHRSRYK